jgi:cation:H+ antiporter
VGSSRLLVWGAVEIAQTLGVSDVIIGLTVVAIGTSLPELASCVAAARKGEDDIALGNVLGSSLFNTLAVVGLAGVIAPMDIDPGLLTRDLPVMAGLTVVLFVMGWGFRGPGRINRYEGSVLLAIYVGYTVWLLRTMAPIA